MPEVLPTGLFPKVKIRFENARLEVSMAPFPPKKTMWGELVVLSETERRAVRGDSKPGVKITVTVQEAPAARLLAEVGQELADTAKSAGLLPLIWKP